MSIPIIKNTSDLQNILAMTNELDYNSGSSCYDELINRTLTVFDNNDITVVRRQAFLLCRNLVSVNLPNVTVVEEYGFKECYELVDVNLPNVITIRKGGLYFTRELVKIRLPKVAFIGASTFSQGSSLSTLIIDTPSVCVLENTNAFTSTPIASGTGYIYVPRSLVDSYKTATNWSTYANQFRAIEDYPDIVN